MPSNRSEIDAVKAALEANHVPELMANAYPQCSVKVNGTVIHAQKANGDSFARYKKKERLYVETVSGEGGDVFSLIALALTGSTDTKSKSTFQKVMREAEIITGIGAEQHENPEKYEARKKHAEAVFEKLRKDDAENEAKAITEAAQRVSQWIGALSDIAGTPAEAYLRNRGIKALKIPPDVVGYVNGKTGHNIVFIGRDKNGVPTAAQSIRITEDGQKAESGLVKKTHGKIGVAPIKIPATSDDARLFICEGPETALTIHKATGAEVWAVTGVSLFAGIRGKHNIDESRTIVLCPDADAVGSPAWMAFDKGWKEWLTCGNSIYIAHSGYEAGSKADLNDTLMAGGIPAVKRQIDSADAIHVPVADARNVLDRFTMEFSEKADRGGSALWAVAVGVGIGKTQSAIQNCIGRLKSSTRAFIYSAPMHALGRQTVRDIQDTTGFNVARRMGADAINPDSPTGEKMCRNLKEYQTATRLIIDVKTHVCENTCPFRAGCAFLEQGKVKDADGYVTTHQSATYREGIKPTDDERETVFSIIDEDPTGGTGLAMAFAGDLRTAPYPADVSAAFNADFQQDRNGLAQMIEDVARENPRERVFVTRTMVMRYIANGDSKEALLQMLSMRPRNEWTRVAKPASGKLVDVRHPDPMIAHNRTVKQFSAIWGALSAFIKSGEEVSPTLHITTGLHKIEPQMPAIANITMKVMARNEATTGNVLLLDATGAASLQQIKIGRKINRQLRISAQQPMLRVAQDWSQEYGMSWTDEASRSSQTANAAIGNINKLVEYISGEAVKHGKDILVVTNKELAVKLTERNIPGAIVRHFNALRGDNSFKHMRRAIIIGRPMPSPRAVEDAVRAFYQRPIIGEHGMVPMWRPVIQEDGSIECQKAMMRGWPDDPQANEFLQTVVASELIQVIGRLRAVNATEECFVTVLGSTVLQANYEALPVHPIDVPWVSRFNRCPIEDQAKAGNFVFGGHAAAYAAYPQLWASEDAARGAFRRHGKSCPKCQLLNARRSIGEIWGSEGFEPQNASARLNARRSIRGYIERRAFNREVAFTMSSKAKRPSKALTHLTDPVEIEAKLKAALGDGVTVKSITEKQTIEKENTNE